jgi:CHASE3 domain sensor protein
MPSIIRYRPEVTGGLTRRTVIASGLLAVIIGTAFGVLVLSIIDLNGVEERSRRAEEVLVVANQFERLLVDAETGVRGFVITRSEDFLEPWQTAQTDFPDQAKMLEQLVADNPGQLARAQQIAAAGRSYLMDYTVPLVDTVRRTPLPHAPWR